MTQKTTLSLCLIMRDESKTLRESLSSVCKYCDEIIVVDTGSKDNSKQIASEFTDKIYDFEWIDDFSAARNFAQFKATSEYIMRWDGDCVMQNQDEIQKWKNKNFEYCEILNAQFFAEGKEADNKISQIMPLIYRREDFIWQSPIHNELAWKNYNIKMDSSKVKTGFEIIIYHYKGDHKSYRYDQTFKILSAQVKKFPTNSRYLYLLSQHFIRTKEYKEVKKYILQGLKYDQTTNFDQISLMLELVFFCDNYLKKPLDSVDLIMKYKSKLQSEPRFKLLLADIKTKQNQRESIVLYEDFLKQNFNRLSTTNSFDPERYLFHPNYTLGILMALESRIEIAKKYLSKARSVTLLKDNQELVDQVLRMI